MKDLIRDFFEFILSWLGIISPEVAPYVQMALYGILIGQTLAVIIRGRKNRDEEDDH